MNFEVQELATDSPAVQSGWWTRSGSESPSHFISASTLNSELVFTRQPGSVRVTLLGPATWAFRATTPLDAEFLGLTLRPGTYLPAILPALTLGGGVDLPLASSHAFWLRGSAIAIPREDELDAFVEQLQRSGELQIDLTVQRLLAGQPLAHSSRTLQRQFLHATGILHRQFIQIQRANEAARRLQAGESIADVAELCGYSDQPHLTRAMRRYWGQTPAQLGGRQRGSAVVSVQDLP